jgi:EAL domain-containing protein (putative c-di-GMP-specific phosphodiesterase class I)/ActR/RegA family two-component response regulator
MGKLEIGSAATRLEGEHCAGQVLQRVFVVDDEPAILDVLSRGLDGAGFKATTFSSGRDFERAVVREAPDICIMDLSLPDFDGVAILNELAAQDYRGRILLMSGHGQQVLRSVSRLAEGYHLHIVGCVKKPFTMKPVLQLLNGSPLQTFAPERADVVDAIRNGQMVVRYQPIVDLPNHQVVAAEALARWQHPTEGLLPPSAFLSKLDHEGMLELTHCVLRNIFYNRALWARQGIAIKLAVNVPTAVVIDPQFAAELAKLMERHQTTLEGLVIEITENDNMPDVHLLAGTLSGFCLKGARVAVDDFGTGFSSLSRLQCLPIDEVKIDKSFIRHCCTHHDDRKIVEAVIALAHALDMHVVAEGVETEATASLLCELGCDYAQGYLFGRPVSPSELAGLVPRANDCP